MLQRSAAFVFMESMILTQKIDTILKDKGLKQVDLASMIGVTPQRVSNWFQGTGQPKPYHLLMIARSLGVTMEYLADDEMNEPSSPTITGEEWEVLRMVRDIGIDAARKRLMQAPTVDYDIPESKTLRVRKSGR